MKYPKLSEPIRIGTKLLRNRIICAPTGMQSDNLGNHIPEEETLTFLGNHAKYGAAMVVVTGANLFPVPEGEDSFIYDVYSKKGRNALAVAAARFHMYGAKCLMELFRAAGGVEDYGVCDGTILPNGMVSREMPEEYMNILADAYAETTYNLKLAGFDGVLLHYGHGWPIAQFMSPLTNRRKDKYGGSVENRARFPKMIIDRIREKVGKDMIIDIRMSIDELESGGLCPEEAIQMIEIFQDSIDAVNASCGLHNPKWFTHTHPCGFEKPMPNAYLARMCKESGKIHIPISAIGGVQDFDAAEELLATGGADMVYVGRGFIADEKFAQKGFSGRNEDIRPCVKCMRCHDSTVFEHKFHCAVNPVIGYEHLLKDRAIGCDRKERVAVIGGGPAGMQAALSAAESGYKVTIFEKSYALGGKLKFAEHVSFKYALDNYMKYQIAQIGKSDIEVILNKEITPSELGEMGYDIVIPALGANAIVPPVKGVEKAVQAMDVYGKESELPENIVVVGGGQVGCETALHLAFLGKKVRLLEMRPDLAPDASPTHRNELMYTMCTTPNLVCEVGAKMIEISDDGVVYEKQPGVWKVYNKVDELFENLAGAAGIGRLQKEKRSDAVTGEGKKAVAEGECVILALGLKSQDEEAMKFFGCAEHVIPIGDCMFPPSNVENAVREAFNAVIQCENF